MVEKHEIDPSYLHLEITESAYTENPEQIISTVEELRNKGFIIEMDDFGSGYSSLNMPGEMSLVILKLDMKFIRNQMSKPAERSLLKAIRCDYAQGYFYAKPTASADYE